jgi:NifU-like protein involved in Fe-S cluster formation
MTKSELNNYLKQFYTSARKKDGSHCKKTTMKAIRAAIERFLRKSKDSVSWEILPLTRPTPFSMLL